MTIHDWPVSYDELEPHYDKFDKICAVSGQAGNLRGKIVAAATRSRIAQLHCNKPIKTGLGPASSATPQEPQPHPVPAAGATSSAPYVNPEGLTLGNASTAATATAPPARRTQRRPTWRAAGAAGDEFRLRTRLRDPLVCDKGGRKVTGVLTDARTGEEYDSRPASWCCPCVQQHPALLAGIGSRTTGDRRA
jgi:gluconate 2-dehydrogenase alpha chain